MKRILITGINGYIGSHLARHLATVGYLINGCGTETHPSKALSAIVSRYTPAFLNKEIPDTLFQGVDVVIHTAHSFRSGDYNLNVYGTKQWFLKARSCGAQQQIYFSSYAAKPNAEAEYGRIKYDLESFFLENHATIVRPGFVMGPGGMFGRMTQLVSRLPIIPLFNGGRESISLIPIATLCLAIEEIIHREYVDVYNLFCEPLWTMRQLVETIALGLQKKRMILPIPTKMILVVFSLLDKLPFTLPFNKDNVISLTSTQSNNYRSDLMRLGIGPSLSHLEVLNATRGVYLHLTHDNR